MLEVLTGVLCFLNIVDTVFKVRDKIVSLEDKKSASFFLQKIGTTLNEVAASLENNVYPHDKCSEIYSYLINFKTILNDKISTDKIQELDNYISNAYRVEQLLGQLNQLRVDERIENINILKSTAGSFIAASTIINL